MKITWTLEKGTVDPDDLLGAIYLEHQNVIISDELTFLDSWFRGLIKGLEALRSGQFIVAIDLIDEPDPLLFDRDETGVYIAYQLKSMPACSLEEFSHALTISAAELLAKVKKEAINRNFSVLKPVIDFLKA